MMHPGFIQHGFIHSPLKNSPAGNSPSFRLITVFTQRSCPNLGAASFFLYSCGISGIIFEMRRSILFSYLRGKPVHPVLLTAERESGNLGGIAGGAAGGE